MTLRHSCLCSARSSSISNFSISSSMHLLQLFLGFPTSILPATSIIVALHIVIYSPVLFTWPNHRSLFLRSLLPISSPSHLLRTSSLATRSCHLTPAMELSILLFVVLIIPSDLSVKGHVSEPYIMAGLIHASYTLALCIKGTPRFTRRLEISLHFIQAVSVLPLTAISTPPSQSSSSPRYWRCPPPPVSPPKALYWCPLPPVHPCLLCTLERRITFAKEG